ncbi:MAG: TetR/AcrR family transcriptional regulator [Anaerolineaceae bacterium]|nr:MAG: TetR/AcrR family transcriptional regulator [Anaerolineaceae bacterium]
MSPRPNVTDERKAQIINAAEDVFTKKGFDEARMDDIAEETGLSKGTLYLYFKSKDDLIIAILDRIFQREFRAFEQIDLSRVSATETVNLFVDTVSKDIKIMLRLMPVAYEFLALAFRNKTVQKSLKVFVNRYMDILVPIIENGIASGEFKEVDPQEVAIAMGAILEGTILIWVYDKSLVKPEENIRSGIRLLLEGVQA